MSKTYEFRKELVKLKNKVQDEIVNIVNENGGEVNFPHYLRTEEDDKIFGIKDDELIIESSYLEDVTLSVHRLDLDTSLNVLEHLEEILVK